MTRKLPRRIAAQPEVEKWPDDALLSFEEAAALLWPQGSPLTASSLRTAYRQGYLNTTMVARKLMTTRADIKAMLEAAKRPAKASRD